MKDIKHIFFDLDHTLWDFETNSKTTLQELFIEFDLTAEGLKFETFFLAYKRINELYWRKYRENKVTKEELRVGRFLDAFSDEAYQVSYEYASKFARRYLEICPHKTNLFPNAISTLQYLQGKYQLHILTNGFKEVQHIKLKESKLTSYFQTVICSEELGIKKPNPEIFQYAMKRVNARPDNSIMIGDSFEADVQGALNVQMKAILFNVLDVKIDNHINQVKELSELVRIF